LRAHPLPACLSTKYGGQVLTYMQAGGKRGGNCMRTAKAGVPNRKLCQGKAPSSKELTGRLRGGWGSSANWKLQGPYPGTNYNCAP